MENSILYFFYAIWYINSSFEVGRMKKLFEFIKKFFKSIIKKSNRNTSSKKQIKINKKAILEVNVGDIIWAKRYHTEEEKLEILEGHREGPFLVIKKISKGLICSYGTSKLHNYNNCIIIESNECDNLYKETYIGMAYDIDCNQSDSVLEILDSNGDNWWFVTDNRLIMTLPNN